MLDHNAEAFCRISSIIGQGIIGLHFGHPPNDKIIAGTLGELHDECKRIGIKSVEKQVQRIKDAHLAGQMNVDMWKNMLYELYNRLRDDLEARVFLSVEEDLCEYYKQTTPAFGATVERTFPQISEDVSEAGKCLALGRCTACVFHLMRAMEAVVKVLGDKLNVTVIDKNNVDLEWGKILSNIEDKVAQMPKGEMKDRWSAAFSLLLHTKIAWRNPTMHPKQTYTPEQSRDVFNATRAFIVQLSALV
jgi:hypothetical protein